MINPVLSDLAGSAQLVRGKNNNRVCILFVTVVTEVTIQKHTWGVCVSLVLKRQIFCLIIVIYGRL